MQVITKADIGGAQVHVRQILAGLGARYDFILVTGSDDYLAREAERLGIEVVMLDDLVRPIRPGRDLKALVALYRLIRRRRPDLVHAHSFKAGMLARLAARLARTRAVFTAHGWAFTPGAPLGQRVIGLAIEFVLCRLCAGVITVSRHDRDLAARWHVGAAARRHLVANAADPVAPGHPADRQAERLMTVGRLTPVKNQAMLLRVLRRLPDTVTLFVVGEGVERSALESLARELDIEHRLVLAGEVTAIRASLTTSAIFLLSSHYEGLPVSILEAMSAGLPVVATAVGGVPEAVLDGETGFVTPRGDETAFADRIRRLLEDPEMAQRMGQAGRRHYLAHYTPERFHREVAAVYEAVRENRG